MSAALSQSKRFLIIALTLLTVVAGLNALQLVNASSASAAPAFSSATAGAPKAGITCDEGFNACAGSISTSGGTTPNTGGVVTTPGSTTPAGNGFSFLTQCTYLVSASNPQGGSAFQLGPKYPINAKNAGEALSYCAKAADGQTLTQKTKPNPGPTGSFGVPDQCEPIKIDGQWTAAIGMINQSTAGWTKVTGSQPTKWTIHFNYSCVYPSHKADYFANQWSRWCLMNNNAFRIYYTQTASIAGSGSSSSWGSGDIVQSKTGVDPDPEFKVSTSKTCAQGLEKTWQNYKLPQASTADGYNGPKYGFYRFSIKGTQILCSGQDPAAWTGNASTRSCDTSTKEPIYAHVNYTYTCNKTGFEKTGPSQSDAQYFLPSGCVTFTCDIDPTKIAQQSPSTPVSVLRNGEQTNTRIGNFTVVDKPASSITGVKNKQVKLNVVSGSSPDNPTVGSNDKDEWYKVMNQVTGTRIDFGSWTALANNSNPLKVGLIFYWASDPDSHWQQRQSYKFDATYHVWRQDSVNSSPYLDDIPQPNKICSNTTTSSKVSVLRSISQVTP